MSDEMGTVRVDIEVEKLARGDLKRLLPSVPVDPGAMLSWVPQELLESLGVERNDRRPFRRPDGAIFERSTGSVWISLAARRTADIVVFAEPGDLVFLGAHTLSGLNLLVDRATGQLVDAGPAPAAVAA